MKKPLYLLSLLLLPGVVAPAQVLQRMEKKVERKVNRRIDRRADKAIDKGLDEVEDALDGKKEPKPQSRGARPSGPGSSSTSYPAANPAAAASGNDPELRYSGTVLYRDDFDRTLAGDFPAGLTSSSGGEVLALTGGKGFRFFPNSNVLLGLSALPENFALEFDLTLRHVPPSLYNTYFNIYLQSLRTLKHNDPKNQYGAVGFSLWGDKKEHQFDVFNKKAAFEIKEKVPYDVNGNLIDNTAHFVILRNKNRLRLYINGEKVTDSPNLLEGVPVNQVCFRLNGTRKEDNRDFIISKVKVTAIAKDLRAQWQDAGRFSTSEIYFETGSASLLPSSAAVLQQVAEVLRADAGARIRIIGHTDNTGAKATNQSLSEQRAEAVKNRLSRDYGISAGRMSTQGLGDTQPLAPNNSEEGRQQNRRVEFVRQ